MLEILRAVFQQFPTFIYTLSSPYKYPLRKVRKKGDQGQKTMTGMSFLLFCFVIVILLHIFDLNDGIVLAKIARDVLVLALTICLIAGAIFLAWRAMGSKVSFNNYLIIYSYQMGVVLIAAAFASELSWGVLYFMNKELIGKKIDSAWLKNPSVQIALVVQLICILGTVVWFCISWRAYRLLNDQTKIASFLALLLSIIFSAPIIFITLLLLNDPTILENN